MSAIQKLIDRLTSDGGYADDTHAARIELRKRGVCETKLLVEIETMKAELQKLEAENAAYAELVIKLRKALDEFAPKDCK